MALGIERTGSAKRVADARARSAFLVQSGPGAERAASAATAALAAGASALVSWGLAGGLAPSSAPGDVVLLPRRVRALHGAPFDVDPEWHARARERRSAAPDVAPWLDDSAQRARGARDAGRQSRGRGGAVRRGAVDMESAAIAAVAARARARVSSRCA